jgi:DNA-binding transcriptional LysR family regulator
MHALIPGAMETIPADSRTRFALDLCIRGLGVWMSRNTADIAVVGLPFSQTDMEARVFAEVSLVAVLPEGHPLAEYDRISIAQMRKERFIALRPSTLLRSQIDLAASHENVFFAPSVECASGPATCQLVANGVGITIADPIVASSFSMQRIVTRPLTKDIRLLYGILHYPDMALSEQACDFLDRLINTAFRLGGEQVHLPYPSNHAF